MGLPWIACIAASLTAAVTLSTPGEAAASNDTGAFFTNDGAALSLLGMGAGTGTFSSTATITRTGTYDSYASRITNLTNTSLSGDSVAAGITDTVEAAQVAEGFAPALTGIGTIAVPTVLAAGAFLVGWKIGRSIDDMYQRLSMHLNALQTGTGVSSGAWVWSGASVCVQQFGTGASCWLFQTSGAAGNQVDRFCDTVSAYCGAPYNNVDVKAAIQAAGGTLVQKAGSTGCSGNNLYPGNCVSAVMSAATMTSLKKVVALDTVPTGAPAPSWYTSGNSSQRSSPYTVPSTAGDATHLAAGRAALDTTAPGAPESSATTWVNTTAAGGTDPFTGGTATTITVPDCLGQTADQCTSALRAAGFLGTVTTYVVGPADANTDYPHDGAIVELPAAGATVQNTGSVTIDLNPDTANMPFAIPQPGPNETYDAYVARLRALGWVGTASVVVLDDAHADPQTGPNGVVRITTTTGYPGQAQTLTRATWPLPLPRMQPSPDITFEENPPTATTAPTPGPLPGGGSSGCNCPALDMSPLENVNAGNAFPFGVFTYVHDLFNQLTVTGVPISFHLTSAFGGGAAGQTVVMADSSWEATYRPRVFTVIEFLITLAAVVFFALKVLGLGGGDE